MNHLKPNNMLTLIKFYENMNDFLIENKCD